MANPIRLRRGTNIGAVDAESDSLYLENCFVDTGDVDALLDCQDPRCLILGRTGVGKTALIRRILKVAPHAKELSPESLALNYLANSNIINFFEAAGVGLDIFYTLLWRHIITVELLKLKFGIQDQQRQVNFFEYAKTKLARNRAKERALQYLRQWGDHFWEETEYRTKEFTEKLETDLKGSVKVEVGHIAALGAEGARRLSAEQKVEVHQRGMQVVNGVQVKELHDIIEFLGDDIFTDSNDTFFVVIDRLDEDWVDDRIRFKLIKALIEAVRTFRHVVNVKIIVAMRTDLHYRVIRETTRAGFQEEKYRSHYLMVRWTREQLVKLLDVRVAFMFKRQYTLDDVRLGDILPRNQLEQRNPEVYIIDRTFFRPREAIIFLNECLARSENQTRISVRVLRQAEVTYSNERLISLADEWRREYPGLSEAITFLNRRENPFRIENISPDDCQKLAEHILANCRIADDPIFQLCEEFYTSGGKKPGELLEGIIGIFYHVGLVGIKPDPQMGRQWSFVDAPMLTKGQLKPQSTIDVHKTFWAALGTEVRSRGGR